MTLFVHWGQRRPGVPELLPQVGLQVPSQPAVVLQTREQEAAALEQQDGPGRAQEGALQARQDPDHLLGLVPDEGRLQGQIQVRVLTGV